MHAGRDQIGMGIKIHGVGAASDSRRGVRNLSGDNADKEDA